MFTPDPAAERFGALPVDNVFFTDYLPNAKGDQVRVYLYGLYHSIHPKEGFSLSEMAHDLSLDEGEILSALRYWERRGLVSRTRTDPPEFVFYSPLQRSLSASQDMADGPYVEFAENVYSLFGARRRVTSEEVAEAYEWVVDIGLPAEVVLMLISHLIASRGVHFRFKTGEMLAVTMKEEGVQTPEDADRFFREDTAVRDGCRRLLRHLGKRREATQDESALYAKWLKEWSFTEDAIIAACSEMTKGDPSFAYLDSILLRLHDKNAASGEDVFQSLTSEKQKREDMRLVLDTLGLSITLKAFEPVYDGWLKLYPLPVILLAAKECRMLQRGKAEKTEDMLESWKNRRGLKDEEDVTRYLAACREQNRRLKLLFEKMGYTGPVTEADRELLRKWQSVSISDELLDCAAEQSFRASGSKMHYMDTVLEQWMKNGIKTANEARSRAAAPKAGTTATAQKVLNAQNYSQRQYTREEMDDLQRKLIQEALRDDE